MTPLRSVQEAEKLFHDNRRLIPFFLRRSFPRLVRKHRADCEQEASVRLWKAALTFDPSKGCKFSTYAMTLMGVRGDFSPIPSQGLTVARDVCGVVRGKFKPAYVNPERERAGRKAMSMSREFLGESSSIVIDKGPSNVDARDAANHVWSRFASLPTLQRLIMERKYPPDGGSNPTFADIARELGYTREHINRQHAEAVNTLRELASAAA